MAEGIRYVCRNCSHAIEAWSDGNPYYLDADGQKQYAYHPDHKGLARCVGNDTPHLCLGCGVELIVDSRSPTAHCPRCGSDDITATFALEGKPCPFCSAGVFAADPGFHAIS